MVLTVAAAVVTVLTMSTCLRLMSGSMTLGTVFRALLVPCLLMVRLMRS